MRAGMLAIIGGVIILYSLTFVPVWWSFWIIAVGAGISGFITRSSGPFVLWVFCICGALGLVAWQLAGAVESLNRGFASVEPLEVLGYPCSMPEPARRNAVTFTLCTASGTDWQEDWPESVPDKIRVTLPDTRDRFLVAGPQWFSLKPDRGMAPVNTGGYRQDTRFFRHGIGGSATITEHTPAPDAYCPLRCRYHRWRQGMVERVDMHLKRMDQPALVESLLLGSRGRLSDQHWETLQSTGTNHLVAISGLHVGMIAVIVAWLGRSLMLQWRGEGGAARPWGILILVLVVCGFYALLAGFTVPTRRALVMVAVGGMALAAGRQYRPFDAWLLALTLVLVMDPLSALDMGLWLSFGAVGCLLLAFAGKFRQPGFFRALGVAQLAIMAGLWPLLTVLERPTTVVAFLANLLAIPLMSVAVMPVLLFSVPLVLWSPETAAWVEPGLSVMLDTLWRGLEALQAMAAPLPPLDTAVVGLIAVGMLLMLYPVPGVYRWVTGMLIAVWCVMGPWQISDNVSVSSPEVRFLDVGNGQAVVIRSGNKVALYDIGLTRYRGQVGVDRQLLPALRKLGVERIDLLVLGHEGQDGTAVWESLEGSLPVGEYLMGGDNGSDIPAGQLCDPGLVHKLGELRLHFWRDTRAGLNSREQSCVVTVAGDNFVILLPGAIGREGERRLLRWLEEPAAITGLLAPDSGRKGSSQQGWIERLDPEWVVFSGRQRGAPAAHDTVVDRYRNQGVRVLLAAEAGEVTFNAEDGSVTGLREQGPFWWRSQE